MPQGVEQRMGFPEQCAVRCPRCQGRAIVDEPFAFFIASEGMPDTGGRPCHRWGGWYVVEKYPALLPWKSPRGSEQALSTANSRRETGHYVPRHTGIVKCTRCHLVAIHLVRWPDDAFYQWEIRGVTLWAWSREHAHVLLTYLAGSERHLALFPGWGLAACLRK